MNKQTKKLVRSVAALDESTLLKLRTSKDDEISDVLQQVGLSLPASNWVLVILKIALYAIGLILAGVGTIACTNHIIY